MQQCKNCQHEFEVTEKDLDFYKRVGAPAPSFCPKCRKQRRLAFRNERNLYLRNCDFSGKQMVTVYSPDKPAKVFHHDIWWSDKWDAKNYAMDFDFNKPFFAQFAVLQQKVPRMNMIISHCENSNYAPYSVNSKNCEYCFEAEGLEDCKFIYTIPKNAADCYDCHYSQGAELCYDSISAVNDYNCRFVLHSWDVKNSSYVQECYYSSDLFGCIGLKQSKYFILNKQYAKEEYEELLPRIILHMEKNSEWGEYCPISMSPFAYNESLAQEFFPLEKEGALKIGCRWKDRDLAEYKPSDISLPGDTAGLTKDLIGKPLSCGECGRNYKLVEQEFNFYKRNNLPAPDKCYNCRHKNRIKTRNLSSLWDVDCGRCHQSLKSSYNPSRYRRIFCEKCFLDAMN